MEQKHYEMSDRQLEQIKNLFPKAKIKYKRTAGIMITGFIYCPLKLSVFFLKLLYQYVTMTS